MSKKASENKNLKDTVCAVVVTYNRKNLLLECLGALLKQTKPIDAMYIIDNFSSDGTPETLKENGYITNLPPDDISEPWGKEFEVKNLTDGKPIKIHYVRMNENTGGAGGFYEGVKRGYEKGYDWLWLMDDDAIPNKDCLVNMVISKLFKKESTGILVPVIYGVDGKIQKYHHKILNSMLEEKSALGNKNLYLKDMSNKQISIRLDANCFVGPLINRRAINKVGFPNKEFFIWADDLEYTYRISRYFPIYLIPQSFILHKDFNPITFIRSKNRKSFKIYWKVYYAIRNMIYFKINYLNLKYKLFLYNKLLYQFVRYTVGILLYDDHKLKRFKIIFFAFYDGIRGKLGKRFRPDY